MTTSPFNPQKIADRVTESDAAEHARRSLEHVQEDAHELAEHGRAAIRNGVSRAREVFADTSDRTAQYVQEQPLKSLLWAVAAGAGVALLAGLLTRHRDGNR